MNTKNEVLVFVRHRKEFTLLSDGVARHKSRIDFTYIHMSKIVLQRRTKVEEKYDHASCLMKRGAYVLMYVCT
jgi:hypothetical protein